MASPQQRNYRKPMQSAEPHRYAGLIEGIDYKDTALLRAFLSNYKRILPARRYRLTGYQQRTLAQAVKRARTMALLPYTNNQ